MNNFNEKLDTFIDGCFDIVDQNYAANYPRLRDMRKTIIRKDGGRKFMRVVRAEIYNGSNEETHCSVHCFVALEDGYNKNMGHWKAGDVFKPAGWKAPARAARGNIFDDNNGLGRMGPYGPGYNR